MSTPAQRLDQLDELEAVAPFAVSVVLGYLASAVDELTWQRALDAARQNARV